MAKEIGFKKWSRGSRVLCELDQNRPYVVCLNC